MQNDVAKEPTPSYSNSDSMSNVRDMGRYGIKLIQDIADHKFNFFRDGHIFRNADFINATIKEIDAKIFDAQTHVSAMQSVCESTDNDQVKNLYMRDCKIVEAYMLEKEYLIQVSQTDDVYTFCTNIEALYGDTAFDIDDMRSPSISNSIVNP